MPWDPTPEHARTWLLPSDIAKLCVRCGRDCTMPDRVARELLDISERVYSKLLSLYPARHRREYGSLMAQLFRDQMRDAYGQNGVRGLVQVGTRTLWDLVVTVPGEHARVASRGRLLRIPLYLLVGLAILCLTLWATRTPAHAALRTGKAVTAVVMSPDGRIIVAGTMFGGMHAWDVGAKQLQYGLTQSGPSAIYSVAFSHDGQLLASGTPCGPLGCVQLWDATTGELVRVIEGHARGIQVINREGQVEVWDLPGDVWDVSFSPEGLLLASAGTDGAIELVDVSSGQLVRAIYGRNKAHLGRIAFSPDGRTLAATQEGVVLLWDVDSGDIVRTLEGHAGRVSGVAFGPDGRTLASAGFDQTIRLWDADTGRLLQRFEQDAHISSLAISPDGQVLASGDWENRIWLWSLTSGELLHAYRGHRWDPFDNGVLALAFSPDGRTLVSGGEDGRVVLWDVPEG
jgi:WD40 repeat protein